MLTTKVAPQDPNKQVLFDAEKYLQKMSTYTNYTDVTFKVKGEEFRGHKMVFARCPFFYNLFTSNH